MVQGNYPGKVGLGLLPFHNTPTPSTAKGLGTWTRQEGSLNLTVPMLYRQKSFKPKVKQTYQSQRNLCFLGEKKKNREVINKHNNNKKISCCIGQQPTSCDLSHFPHSPFPQRGMHRNPSQVTLSNHCKPLQGIFLQMEAVQVQLLVSKKEAHLQANNQASFIVRQRTEALATYQSIPVPLPVLKHRGWYFRAAPA